MTNAAISAQGSTLGVSATGTSPISYTLIKQLTGFPVGPGQANQLDSTNLDST
jgi:hypothetical protein